MKSEKLLFKQNVKLIGMRKYNLLLLFYIYYFYKYYSITLEGTQVKGYLTETLTIFIIIFMSTHTLVSLFVFAVINAILIIVGGVLQPIMS